MEEKTHANTDAKLDIRTVNYGKSSAPELKPHDNVVNVRELQAACNILTTGTGTDPAAKRGAEALRDILLATAHAPYVPELQKEVLTPVKRLRLPKDRQGITHKFRVDNIRCYIIVNVYPDTKLPGELFIHIDKGNYVPGKPEGAMLSGFADSWGILFSLALQYGIPLKDLVYKFKHAKFPPYGMTDSRAQELKFADSVIDYIVRWMEMRFLKGPQRRVVAHCEPCNVDFYSLDESIKHDKENIEKHRTADAQRRYNSGATNGKS